MLFSFQHVERMTPSSLHEQAEESLTFPWNMDIPGSYSLHGRHRTIGEESPQMEWDVPQIKDHLKQGTALHALLS